MTIDLTPSAVAIKQTPALVREVHDRLQQGAWKMIAWGASDDYRRLAPVIPAKAQFIVDRNVHKQGTVIDDVPVVSEQPLIELDPSNHVVVVFTDAFEEVRQSIALLGPFLAIPAIALTNLAKPDATVLRGRHLLPEKDYVSPNLSVVVLDECFPNVSIGDRSIQNWVYHRKTIDHNFLCDWRRTSVGFLDRDEAHILYHNAIPFAGKPALEIGCWLGWSACHLALAGVELDIIDPILANPAMAVTIECSLTAANILDRISFSAAYSPGAVLDLGRNGRRWSFAFIDGDHEGEAPKLDAEAVEPLLDENALVLFHDLASPDVTRGLAVFRDRGWNTAIYHTAQIMGVAWRGTARPVPHLPDPACVWDVPQHLGAYAAVPKP